MAVKPNMNFSEAISYIFYVTKLFGLIPYSFSEYRVHKSLVSSYVGNFLSLTALFAYAFWYHYVVTQTYFDGNTFDSGKKENKTKKKRSEKNKEYLLKIGTLTTIIGVFILYMEPIMVNHIFSVTNMLLIFKYLHI